MQPIYLDNQSTTPIDPKVYSYMEPWMKEKFGNPASRNHSYGWEADEAVEIARKSVANIIGARSKEIIFTSGATEANNLALQGSINNNHNNPKHIITVATEHKAILDICNNLEKKGVNVTRLPVESDGILNLDQLQTAIQKETIMISVMHVNNEIGVIQPIQKIGAICKQKKILFHVDAAQSIGKISVNVSNMDIDLLSISAHKLYGPKGVGALYIKQKLPRIQLKPLIFGGGHERGIRPGTLPVSSIVGFGKACDLAGQLMSQENKNIKHLRDMLLNSIETYNQNIKVNGNLEKRISGNLNIRFPGFNNESIIAATPEIAISSGSACTTSTREPSHVLLSLGLSKIEAYSSLRFGIGRFNTEKDIQIASKALNNTITKLSKISTV